MKQKRENLIQAEILNFLRGNAKEGIKGVGGWWLNFHGGDPFMPRGVPDIIGCLQGRFVALEVKRDGEAPTAIQRKFLSVLKRAGAVTAVVHNLEELKEALRNAKLYP